MNRQLPLPAFQITLDAPAAQVAKVDAMERVERHAALGWNEYALGVIKRVAEENDTFTTDEILAAMTDAPVWTAELRALGPRMTAAYRAGFIVPLDKFIKSKSVSRHRAMKRVWQSNLYRKDKTT